MSEGLAESLTLGHESGVFCVDVSGLLLTPSLSPLSVFSCSLLLAA